MKKIQFALNEDYIYKFEERQTFLKKSVNKSMVLGNNKGIYYYNVASCFDIETTSFYIDENEEVIDYNEKMKRKALNPNYNPFKYGCMYVWQFGINGNVIMGRTWEEFVTLLQDIKRYLGLTEKQRLIVYVHNLGFEFQFMRKWLNWDKVFSIEERKPIYAVCDLGIEFRCSYLLSGYSLENLSRDLQKYHVSKMVGDLDYSLLRNQKTPLTDKEIKYCVNDVFVVMAYIQEKIEQERNAITNLPLTKTGYVRNFCRRNTLYLPNTHKANLGYRNLVKDLQIADIEEYRTLERAFAGGFTHCNAIYSDELCEDVTSYDFTSSYPYVMLSEKYPMSRATKVKVESKEQFEAIINNKRLLSVFDIRFNELYTKIVFENYLSVSKCFSKSNVVENNGRVVCADYVSTTLTNIDYEVMKQCYKWDSIQVNFVYVYNAQYLPKDFAECILKFYNDKTQLKGVKGKEIEYMLSKNMLNACYGMAVTSPLRPEYYYEGGEWGTRIEENEDNLNDMINKANTAFNRFLYYIWGIFVTAYARRNLFTGILECENDYIYADTDSIKLFNYESHKEYFDNYNKGVEEKLRKSAKYYNIDFQMFQPKTKEGKIKMMGVWDFDGKYIYFKSLGAKRYMTAKETNNDEIPISITVSGVNKKMAIPYIWEESKHNIRRCFDMFKDGLEIPADKTGKMIHTYCDDEMQGIITDYLGNTAEFYEKSAINLEPTTYDLSIASMYVKYLKGIKTETE